MKINVEISDDMIVKVLTDAAESILWHINNDINRTKKYNNGQIPYHHMVDIQDNFKHFQDLNNVIKYFGGEPVEIKSYNVKFGYDIHGKKFQENS